MWSVGRLQVHGNCKVVCFGVCEAPLNDRDNGGSVSVDDFYTYAEYGFSFNGSWSYSS